MAKLAGGGGTLRKQKTTFGNRTLNDSVLPSRNDYMAHISTRQYATLVPELVVGIGLALKEYDTHSLRRTETYIFNKATENLRAVQILLGNAKIDSTPYLGVDVEDALELAGRTEIWADPQHDIQRSFRAPQLRPLVHVELFSGHPADAGCR